MYYLTDGGYAESQPEAPQVVTDIKTAKRSNVASIVPAIRRCEATLCTIAEGAGFVERHPELPAEEVAKYRDALRELSGKGVVLKFER
jgi:hypothetical protein